MGYRKIFKKSLAMILAFALAVSTVTILDGKAVLAATTILSGGEYSVKATDTSSSQCKLDFTSNSSASYVIVHYKVNGGSQMNVNMAGSGTSWNYTISGLSTGKSIECSFTYNINGIQKDTGTATYVTGTTSSTSSSIEAPFGLVVSSPSNNTIGVVWGRGSIDSYNVYIDGNRVASSVGCGYYTYSGYAAGTHTVAVTTVSGGSESKQTTAQVSVSGSSTGTSSGSDAVCYLYQDINYGGNSVGLKEGNYTLSQLISAGFKNDDMSSIKISSGYQAVLYWDDNYGGSSKTITANTSWIGSDWNDQLSSIKVSKVSSGSQDSNTGNQGSSNTGNGTTSYSDSPVIPNLAARSDRMYFKLNNNTNGKYSNNQIYWCILGYDSNNDLCYVDKNGNLVKASTSMNTISKSDRKCADICYTLAEADYVYMPDIVSGRMYLSYGEQTYITFNMAADGRIGYAGPDLNNASDPNQGVLFEFIEFTIKNKEYWGNTTRVDFYSFPVVTRLIGTNGYTNGTYYSNFDKTVGDTGSRDYIFSQFKNEVPDQFDSLVSDLRIMAPCKKTFNEGQAYASYYDSYINEFWNKYSSETLVFTCDAGTFRGRVSGNVMTFTKDGDSGTYYVYKPTTQDVLEGKGNFNRGNSTELVIEAQLCAAFNRGVATQPSNFNNESAYYKNSTSNFYSGFWHNHSYGGYAYGFCYDDVFDHSTLLHFTNPTGLIVDLRW